MLILPLWYLYSVAALLSYILKCAQDDFDQFLQFACWNSVFLPSISFNDAAEAHTYIDNDSKMSLAEQCTTVDIIQLAGSFNPKVFVSC